VQDLKETEHELIELNKDKKEINKLSKDGLKRKRQKDKDYEKKVRQEIKDRNRKIQNLKGNEEDPNDIN